MNETETYSPRTCVFIDGDHILASTKDSGISLDFAVLRNHLERCFGNLSRLHYYSSNFPQKQGQQILFLQLEELGYQIILEQGRTKSIETKMTTDAISLSQNFDTFVLLSGDGAFAPLLDNLREQGKQTIVIGVKIATNRHLMELASEFIELQDFLLGTVHPKENWYKAPQQSKQSGALNPTRTLRVFLCHSSGDKAKVRDLYNHLKRENNITPWLDEKDILPGQDWDFEIDKAIRESDAVIVCCSRHSVNKEGYVQKEITRALNIADEKPEGTIFIIPIRLEECDVPRRLSRWQWVDLFDVNGYESLLRSLQHRAQKLRA